MTKIKTIEFKWDGFDIASRGVLIDWMYALAEAGEIDTALIFATLKSIPADDEYLHCEWIEDGTITPSSLRERSASVVSPVQRVVMRFTTNQARRLKP